MISSPAVANGLVIVGNNDGKVYAVRTNNGALAWTTIPEAGNTIRGSPMVANGVVYVSGFHKIHALSLATGGLLWSGAGRVGLLNSPVVADGTVYFAGYNGSGSGARLTAFTLFGEPVAAKLPGGELGIRPAISSLKPDHSLKPVSPQ
jgi:outer membrane protein assembly factor BamB